jgi:hypothetical protein
VEPLRCLIAEMPQKILVDIVQKVVEENSNIDVIESSKSIEDLSLEFLNQRINLLILGMKNLILPAACEDLLATYSNLMILGIVADGRKVAVYFNDIVSQDIVNLVNLLGKRLEGTSQL